MQKQTRKEQKETTRLAIIRKAEQLFAKSGISATSTADVAGESGISHGTVFIHFPTREDLILAVFDQFGERLNTELGRRCSTEMSLKELLKTHVAVLADFEDFYLRLIAESQALPVQVRSQLYAMNASFSYRFFRAAKPLMKDGSIKKFEQAAFFNTWLAILHYHIMNRDLFSETFPILTQKGDDLIRHFLTLIKTNH